MVQTTQAKDLTLHEVKLKFGLKLSEDDQFFWEWIDDLPEITDLEKRSLDQVKADYLHIKLMKQDTPQYALSDEFTLRRGNDLDSVLRVLKRLGALLNQDSK